MRYYIIAGEKSGDLYGADLAKAIFQKDPKAKIRGIGGVQMQCTGVVLFQHYQSIAMMGFRFIRYFFRFFRLYKKCQQDILAFQPHAIILIDFAGFNLRMARFAKKNCIKTCYYISPKIWAWHRRRIKNIQRDVDHMFTILPFEKAFYAQYHYPVAYIGHPLVHNIEHFQPMTDFFSKHQLDPKKKIIAFLPGSRWQEVQAVLPILVKIISHFPAYQFCIAAVDSLPIALYQKITRGYNVKILVEQSYTLLSHAHAAVVTSGTATLETLLFDVPQILVYKTYAFTYFLARCFLKIKYIGLVNILAQDNIVTELIQKDLCPTYVCFHLKKILTQAYRQKQRHHYTKVKAQLQTTQPPAQYAARLLMQYLQT